MKKKGYYFQIVIIQILLLNFTTIDGQTCFDANTFEDAVNQISYLDREVIPCLHRQSSEPNLFKKYESWKPVILAYIELESPRAEQSKHKLIDDIDKQIQNLEREFEDLSEPRNQKIEEAKEEIISLNNDANEIQLVIKSIQRTISNSTEELKKYKDELEAISEKTEDDSERIKLSNKVLEIQSKIDCLSTIIVEEKSKLKGINTNVLDKEKKLDVLNDIENHPELKSKESEIQKLEKLIIEIENL